MTPAAHFARFCETLTQSDDRWEGKPFNLEAGELSPTDRPM